jgi:putative protease
MYDPNFNCNLPEILVPVGGQKALLAAIKGRADAIYLGVGEFNARQGTNNFTLEELEDAVDLSHSHDVSVYLALNIPIKQKELQQALEIVDHAYSVGVDAIILQDLGLLSLIKEIYPNLELHMSTQVTIHNSKGVDFVADLGAKRVIVARELTIDEVKAIVDYSKVGIEVFVHGSLCYSYAGKCLFSSLMEGRSANRGACAQHCRRRYRFLVNGIEIDKRNIRGSYPLSCAELSTLTGLEKIVKTGVVSLKIEGRMKKPEYVTASAAAYKAVVEDICNPEKSPTKEELESREAKIAKLFCRGFTRGFILEERDVAHPKYSSNYGVFLGKVLNIFRSKMNTKLTVKLDEDIQVKDGISVFMGERMIGSAVAGIITSKGDHVKSAKKGEKVGLEISSKTGRAIQIGDELYLTTSIQLLDTLQKTKLKTYPVDLKVRARKGERFTVEIREKKGKRNVRKDSSIAEFSDDYIVQGADKAPTTFEQIRKVMRCLGDISFEATDISIDADENIFIPVGVLKSTRRKAAGLLLDKILKVHKKEQKHPLLNNFNYLCFSKNVENKTSDSKERNIKDDRSRAITSKKLFLSVEVDEISSLFEAVDGGADIIYVPISRFEELNTPENAERFKKLRAERNEIAFKIPLIAHDRELDELKCRMEKVRDAGFSIACSDLGSAQLAKNLSIPFVAQKDFNIFNSFTVSIFYQAGAYRVTLSSELNLREIKNICETLHTCREVGQVEILAYGRELVLITENDLLKPLINKKIVKEDSEVHLLDQTGSKFPIKRMGNRTLIYNSKVLNMLKYVKNLEGSGVDIIRLDLSLNNDAEIKGIVKTYKEAFAGKEGKLSAKGIEYTTGHYFKGV